VRDDKQKNAKAKKKAKAGAKTGTTAGRDSKMEARLLVGNFYRVMGKFVLDLVAFTWMQLKRHCLNGDGAISK
jgi:hypothetical protein